MRKNLQHPVLISCCAFAMFGAFAAAGLSAEAQDAGISLLQEKKQNEIISGLYRDMKDLSSRQKEMNKKLSDLQSELADLSKQNELLKQENRRFSLELGSMKKTLPVSKTGNTETRDARSYYEQAEADMKENNFEQAISGFEKSLTRDPRNAQAHYNLGILYEHAQNNRRESVYHLKKYLQLSKDPVKKAEVEYLIRIEKADKVLWGVNDIQ